MASRWLEMASEGYKWDGLEMLRRAASRWLHEQKQQKPKNMGSGIKWFPTSCTRNHPELPGMAQNYLVLPGIARNCPESPGIARNHLELPGFAQNRWELPGIAWNCMGSGFKWFTTSGRNGPQSLKWPRIIRYWRSDFLKLLNAPDTAKCYFKTDHNKKQNLFWM